MSLKRKPAVQPGLSSCHGVYSGYLASHKQLLMVQSFNFRLFTDSLDSTYSNFYLSSYSMDHITRSTCPSVNDKHGLEVEDFSSNLFTTFYNALQSNLSRFHCI